jgi:hypothetical protein
MRKLLTALFLYLTQIASAQYGLGTKVTLRDGTTFDDVVPHFLNAKGVAKLEARNRSGYPRRELLQIPAVDRSILAEGGLKDMITHVDRNLRWVEFDIQEKQGRRPVYVDMADVREIVMSNRDLVYLLETTQEREQESAKARAELMKAHPDWKNGVPPGLEASYDEDVSESHSEETPVPILTPSPPSTQNSIPAPSPAASTGQYVGTWFSETSSASEYIRIEVELRPDGTFTRTQTVRMPMFISSPSGGYSGTGPTMVTTKEGTWSVVGGKVVLSTGDSMDGLRR